MSYSEIWAGDISPRIFTLMRTFLHPPKPPFLFSRVRAITRALCQGLQLYIIIFDGFG